MNIGMKMHNLQILLFALSGQIQSSIFVDLEMAAFGWNLKQLRTKQILVTTVFQIFGDIKNFNFQIEVSIVKNMRNSDRKSKNFRDIIGRVNNKYLENTFFFLEVNQLFSVEPKT